MSTPFIRLATPGDAADVLELWQDAGTVTTRTDDEESIRALIRWDDRALIVAGEDKRLVGSLIAAFDGWRGMLFRAAVRPEYRRSGVARALVAEGERSLRERGAVRASCYAIRTEAGAVAFWEAVGYDRDDYTQRLVKNLDV
jgi:ribosomal protein S18 acetylase RimI-like enzyme